MGHQSLVPTQRGHWYGPLLPGVFAIGGAALCCLYPVKGVGQAKPYAQQYIQAVGEECHSTPLTPPGGFAIGNTALHSTVGGGKKMGLHSYLFLISSGMNPHSCRAERAKIAGAQGRPHQIRLHSPPLHSSTVSIIPDPHPTLMPQVLK